MVTATTDAGRRYRILGTIGKGGFGTVYRAEMIGEGGFSKVVALKVLNPEVSEIAEVAERLRDEARVLGLVHHRAIVQVDGLVKLAGRWTIVMEWVNGLDLKHLVAEGPMPPGPALEVVTEVASALRAAKEQPGPDGKPLALLHRDIKPSNITLTPAGEVKVLDFGTARANFATREAKTQMMAFGTLDYMAPERLEFVDVPAGDIYSLGAVLYEVLTGEALGHTVARPGRHQEKRREAVERLRELGVHEGVVELIREMLAFEPDDRPALREIEGQCRELRTACGGPWLSDWAAEVIPGLLARRTTADGDDMVGVVLEEGTTDRRILPPEEPQGGQTRWYRDDEGEPSGPPPAPEVAQRTVRPEDALVGKPARRPKTLVAVVAGLALLFLGAGIVAGLFLLPRLIGPSPEPVPEPVAPAAVEEPVAPATEPDTAVPVAEGVDDEAAEPSAEEARPVAPAPVAAPPTPRPAPRATPAPTAPPTGRVIVDGDAERVVLVGSDGARRDPGRVPAGRYALEASFPGRGAVAAGAVTVPEGATVQVHCNAAFARCSVR